MRLSDLLQDEWIAVPVVAEHFDGALASLESALGGGAEGGRGLRSALAADSTGEAVRVTDAIVLLSATTDLVSGLSVAVGLADRPFPVDGAGLEGTARLVLLVLSPEAHARVRATVVPTLTRILRESQRTRELLGSSKPVDPTVFTEALNAELHGRLLVEDALTPVRFRVYPDTPLSAVVDLLVRRRLDRLPVVGESHELLGIITAGDVLRELLPRVRSSESRTQALGDRAARDVMRRSVMCVSEEQSLADVANLMVNRDMGELPVVREGVLVGFLERDTVLRTLVMV